MSGTKKGASFAENRKRRGFLERLSRVLPSGVALGAAGATAGVVWGGLAVPALHATFCAWSNIPPMPAWLAQRFDTEFNSQAIRDAAALAGVKAKGLSHDDIQHIMRSYFRTMGQTLQNAGDLSDERVQVVSEVVLNKMIDDDVVLQKGLDVEFLREMVNCYTNTVKVLIIKHQKDWQDWLDKYKESLSLSSRNADAAMIGGGLGLSFGLLLWVISGCLDEADRRRQSGGHTR